MSLRDYLIVLAVGAFIGTTLIATFLFDGYRAKEPDIECQEVVIESKGDIEYVEVLGEYYLVRRGPGGSPEIVGRMSRFYETEN